MAIEWINGFLGGLLISIAGVVLLLGNGRILDASRILGSIVDRSPDQAWPEWLAFILGLVAVPAIIQNMIPVETNSTQGTGYLIAAGICVGIGTRMAKGCTSGHGVSGVSGLSLRGIVATVVYIEAGVLTVFAISNF